MNTKDIRPLAGVRVLELGNYIAAPDRGPDAGRLRRRSHQGRAAGHRRRAPQLAAVLRGHVDAVPDHQSQQEVHRARPQDRARPGRSCSTWSGTATCCWRTSAPAHWRSGGSGPEELDRVNPDLVITRISAFGQTGPLSERPGFAAVAEAFGGLRELVGDPDRPPVRTGVSIGDSIAGIYAAFGTVMALFQRERVKVPLAQRVIDVALNESVLSVMESLVPDYLAYGVTRERVGGRMEGIAPSNAYPCADGTSIIVAGNGDAIFQRYMQTIGRPDLADGSGAADQRGPLAAPRGTRRRDRAVDHPPRPRRGAQAARRGRRAVRADLHRRRHLRRRAVRGAKHDPALRRRHR